MEPFLETKLYFLHPTSCVIVELMFECRMQVWYKVSDVMTAWDQILLAVDSKPLLARVSTFRYDLVDLSRQALQLKLEFLYQQVLQAYTRKDLISLR